MEKKTVLTIGIIILCVIIVIVLIAALGRKNKKREDSKSSDSSSGSLSAPRAAAPPQPQQVTGRAGYVQSTCGAGNCNGTAPQGVQIPTFHQPTNNIPNYGQIPNPFANAIPRTQPVQASQKQEEERDVDEDSEQEQQEAPKATMRFLSKNSDE